MIKLGELVMILDLHRQGPSVSAIARQVGIDRETVRTYIAKGLEPPAYKKRAARPERHRSLRTLVGRAPGDLSLSDRSASVAGAEGPRLSRQLQRGEGPRARDPSGPKRRLRSALRDADGRAGPSRLRLVRGRVRRRVGRQAHRLAVFRWSSATPG